MNDKEILEKLRALPKSDQKQIWRKCKFSALKDWQTWLGFLAYITLMAIGTIIGEVFNLRVRLMNLPFMIGMMTGLMVFLFVWRHQLCKHLKKRL